MTRSARLPDDADQFLALWFEVRQLIQTSNFNRFQREGLSATQFTLLNVLNSDSEMTVSELARHLNLGSPTVVRSLDSLERRGLISRLRSVDDRRVVKVVLTQAGRAIQNSARGEFTGKIRQTFLNMSEKGRAALLSGYKEFVEKARETLPSDQS